MTSNAKVLTGSVRLAQAGPVATIRIEGAGVADPVTRGAAADSHLKRNLNRARWNMVPWALENMLRRDLVRRGDLEHALNRWRLEGGGFLSDRPAAAVRQPIQVPAEFPIYRNDIGAREIKIGARAFYCIGEAPPGDHPHIYLQRSARRDIRCPYCSTLYTFDDRLGRNESEPADCFYERLLPEKRSPTDEKGL